MTDIIPRLNAALEGRYRVERALGEGGMAVVYLADDLRHERRVGLKVLKPELAAVVGADRFLTEIKTTANLQHPHILPLFDSGEADGFLFYVMPYVEGESLGERLRREEQLPVDEAIRLATDVAEALGHAHAHGVVHRDIKPANILLSGGRPLVADFGIALAVSAAGGGRLTETGLSLGTPYYMSPEQATADRDADARSDIYSLTCVLYEMLVGEPPFTGSSAQAVLGKILAGDPMSPRLHRKSVPEHVEAVIFHGLERLPADRFQSADAFADALRDPGFRRTGPRSTASKGGGRWRWQAVAGILGVALAASLLLRPSAAPTLGMRLTIPVPEGYRMSWEWLPQLGISPDGATVAYFSNGVLFTRRLNSFEPTAVVKAFDGVGPSFSPNGEALVYSRGTALWRVPVEGGPVTHLVENAPTPSVSHWTADGIVFIHEGFAVWMADADGRNARPITEVLDSANETQHRWPQLLPDGSIMYTIMGPSLGWNDALLVIEDPETGVRATLVEQGSYGRYLESGYVLFVRSDQTLMAAPLDLRQRRLTATPEAVLSGVDVSVDNAGASYAVSNNGTLVYVEEPSEAGFVLSWMDRSGASLGTVGSPINADQMVLSPDGTVAAFSRREPNDDEVWLMRLGSGDLERVTFAPAAEDETPIWSPDGTRLAYTEQGTGRSRKVFVLNVGTNESPEVIHAEPAHIHITSWSPDGRYIAFEDPFETTDIRLLDLESGNVVPVAGSDGKEWEAHFSPDGEWLAYTSDESGEFEVYVVNLPSQGGKRQVSLGGGQNPRWSADGSELFFQSTRAPWNMYSVPVRSKPTFELGAPEQLFELPQSGYTSYAVAPDGRFLVLLPNPGATAREIRVVTGIDQELDRIFGR